MYLLDWKTCLFTGLSSQHFHRRARNEHGHDGNGDEACRQHFRQQEIQDRFLFLLVSSERLGDLLRNEHGGWEAERAADAVGRRKADRDAQQLGAQQRGRYGSENAAGRCGQQRRQNGQHLLRRGLRQIGKDQNGDEKRDQARGLRFSEDAFIEKAQCEEYRAHDQAHDEVVNRAAGQLGRIVRDDRNDCQLGEVHRRTLAAFRQMQRTVMCRIVFLLQSAVLLHEHRIITDELCGAAKQKGRDRYADELLRHVKHDAERRRRREVHLLERARHDERCCAAACEDRCTGDRHLAADERPSNQYDCCNCAAHAAQRGDDYLPLPTQLREVDRRAERHDEQAGNDVAEPGDLRVVDQCARQDAAPEACKQQDRNAEHCGEYCFGFLRNQLADCVDAE